MLECAVKGGWLLGFVRANGASMDPMRRLRPFRSWTAKGTAHHDIGTRGLRLATFCMDECIFE